VSKAIRVLGSVALLAFLAWQTDWRHVKEAFDQLRIEYWLAAVGVYALTQVVSTVRWQILARPLGFERPWLHYLSFYFIGMFFNLVLPTSVGGDVVRAGYLDGGAGRRMPAFVSVCVDQHSGLLMLLALACVAVALCPLSLPGWITWGVGGTGAAAGAGLLTVWLASRWRKPTLGTSLGPRPLLVARLQRFASKLHQALPLATRPWPLALSIIVQAANVVVVWLVGLAIGAPVPGSYYWVLVPMVSVLTLLPVSLNGMGVREGGMVLLLAPLGVSTGTAVSLAFLWFAVFTTCSLGGLAFYLFGRFPRFEVSSDGEPVCGDSDQGRARQPQAAA